MGKNKRLRAGSTKKTVNAHKLPKPPTPTQAEWKSKPKLTAAEKNKNAPQQHSEPTIPFNKYDRILLVGEGDLSFAASLVKAHGVRSLTATVLEANRKELEEKYPNVGQNIDVVESWAPEKQEEEESDADETAEKDVKRSSEEIAALAGLDNDEQEALLSVQAEEGLAQYNKPREGKVVFGVDCMKMGPWHDPVAKAAGKGKLGAFDIIQFMFPYCGGKSTDVNRQVRYNQELLVGFFKRAMLSLAPKGSIVVTLFEGQPYELWCIRNLARHVGLQVETSFKFQASAYPGYAHSRTLGVLRNKQGEVTGGGWKGEDRPSRSYIFRRKVDLPELSNKTKKRKKGQDEDDYTDGGED